LQSVGIGVTNLVFTFVGLYLIDRLGRRTLLYIGSVGYIVSLGLCAGAFFAYSAPFDVASKAIEVQQLSERVQESEALAPRRRQELLNRFTTARTALQEASAQEDYSGQPVQLDPDMSPSAAGELAGQALRESSQLAGAGGTIVLLCIFAFIAAHAVGQGAVIWVFIGEIFPNRNRAAGQALGSFTHWMFAALLTLLFPKMIEALAPGYVFAFFCFMMVLQLIWVKLMVPETKNVPLEEMQKQWGM
jgi:MFS family permease